AVEFAIGEIGDAAQKQADGGAAGQKIEAGQNVRVLAAQIDDHGDHQPEHAAVEAHSAVPEGDDLERVGGKDHGIVEQDIAQTPADDDADHDPEGEIEQFVRSHGRVAVGP